MPSSKAAAWFDERNVTACDAVDGSSARHVSAIEVRAPKLPRFGRATIMNATKRLCRIISAYRAKADSAETDSDLGWLGVVRRTLPHRPPVSLDVLSCFDGLSRMPR